MEQDIAANKEKLKRKDLEIQTWQDKLTVANGCVAGLQKEVEELEERYVNCIRQDAQTQVYADELPGGRRTIGVQTNVDDVDDGVEMLNAEADAVPEKAEQVRTYLKNTTSGELVDYEPGDAIPAGWQVIKKVQKKRSTKALMQKFRSAVLAAKWIARFRRQARVTAEADAVQTELDQSQSGRPAVEHGNENKPGAANEPA